MIANIVDKDPSIDKIQVMIDKAQQEWEELKEKGLKIREQELLDFYEVEIGNTIVREKLERKKIITRIQKEQIGTIHSDI